MDDSKGKTDETGAPRKPRPRTASPAPAAGKGDPAPKASPGPPGAGVHPVLRGALLADNAVTGLIGVENFLQVQLQLMRSVHANLEPFMAMSRDIAAVAAWASVVDSRARALALTGAPTFVSVLGDINRSLESLLAPLQSETWRSMETTLAAFSLNAPLYGIAAVEYRRILVGPIYGGLDALRGVSLQPPEVAPATFSTFTASAVIGLGAPATESSDELREAETETRAAGLELIRRHRPEFAEKLEGARYVSERQSPDWMSQAANSLQELTDRVLRELAPGERVLDWCREHYPAGVYEGDGTPKPTRAGKLRYIAARARSSATVAEAMAQILTASVRILQQAKHDEGSAPVLRNFSFIVEGYAGAIIAMAEEAEDE